ncbi:HAMP domain-containing histidine kinase [Candidatus Kaiserbacteria bacterium]|nr:HAMP domain-containing histidine kinase [Candidatus Kaiserbacteria bacterium]
MGTTFLNFDPFPVLVLAVIGTAGLVVGFVIGRLRIGHFKKLLAEKSDLVEKTARQLVEKNLELSDQNIRLQRSLEAKNDFVSVASHQLRTPVTEIKWAIENILDGTYGELTEKQKEQVRNTLESAGKMTRLIDELLHFVDAEAGYREYTITPIEIEPLVTSVLDEAEKRFAEKNIRLERALGFGATPLSGDEAMIEIAVANLVDNAFHYTPSGGTIRVGTERRGDSFVYTVADSGIGILREKQGDIFKKFRRTREALDMHTGGVGLGLYITKNIIEQHGGTITFDSEPGKGTTFTVTLPLSPARTAT